MHRILLDFAIGAEGRKVGKEHVFFPLYYLHAQMYTSIHVYIYDMHLYCHFCVVLCESFVDVLCYVTCERWTNVS